MLSDIEYAQMTESFESMPGKEFVRRAQAATHLHGDDARLWFMLGASHHRLGALEDALREFEHTLELQPDHVQAINACAAILAGQGRLPTARALLEDAVRRFPADASVRANLGYLLEQQGDTKGALGCYDGALTIDPSNQAALMNRGYLLTMLGRLSEAVQNNRNLVLVAPNDPTAHFNLAEVLLAARMPAEALEAGDEALRIAPEHSKARIACGLAMAQLGRIQEAQAEFERVRRNDPEAIRAFANAFESAPSLELDRFDAGLIHLTWLFEKLHVCNWADRDVLVEKTRAVIGERSRKGTGPADSGLAYNVLALPLPASLRKAVAAATSARFERLAGAVSPPSARDPDPERRLRLGYLSPDFREHVNAYLLLPLLKLHERAAYEVTCYSVGPPDASLIRQQVQTAADRFVDVATLDDDGIARTIRDDGIDVLVDVGGYTTYSRPGVLVRRPAPVQVGYLAFPGTQAMAAVPWRIVDRVACPPAQRGDWTEALVYFPDTFYIYDASEPISQPVLSRAEYGLPADAFVFCGFHNSYKIEPGIFSVWMEILRAVPGSVLWLAGRNAAAAANLRREARSRGVDDGRLVFAPYDSRERYRARFALADLFLDTVVFNAMTTACDAIAAGLPLLTAPGSEFPSRVAASVLAAAGFREGVVDSVDAYRDRAIEWGRNPDLLRELRKRRLSTPLSTPLFDAPARVRQLEQAFREMWRRHCLGLPPEDFAIARTAQAWSNRWH